MPTRRSRRSRGKVETYGPFATYEAAHKEWQGRTMQTIDNALMRYRIVNEKPKAA